MKNTYEEKLQKMIQCETISEVGQSDLRKFREFHKTVYELFPKLFAAAEVKDYDGSLLIKWSGKTDKKPLLFMSHHDVVEADGEWEHEPFGGEISDGKIWGRGTLDTKGNLFCMLQAAEELAETGFKPESDIYFESSCNEETTGEGARAIAEDLEKRGIRFEYVLDEGTGIISEVSYDERCGSLKSPKKMTASIAIGEKGVTELEFVARSEGGHASRPPKNTPLVRLGRFMADVEEHLDEIFPKEMNEITGECQQTTIAFTVCEASKSRNVIPTAAKLIVSMRSSHHQTVEKSIKSIADFAAEYDIETNILFHGMTSPLADINSPAYKKICSEIREHFEGSNTVPTIMSGATDACYMTCLSDCVLRFTPIVCTEEQRKAVHANDENIYVESLLKGVTFYKRLFQQGA